MAYIEDLVQEIYTNCHTEGIDKLNQGLQDAIWYSGELEKNLADLSNISKQNMNFQTQALNLQNQSFLSKKQQIALESQQANARLKYLEKEENYQRRKEKRDKQEISHMKQRNALQSFFVKTLGAFFTINTLKNIVETGSKLQLLRQSIVGLTKDTQDWDYIKKTAQATGNSLEVVARGYKNFYAAANMAGFSKNSIQTMYSDMVMATRAIGASSQQTEGALLALEQMISKGTVSMEELRRQLGNAVPGAFEIGAKAMNMTTKEFNEFVKKGELASAVFVPKFIAEFKKQYISGFKEISKTFNFAMGQLKSSLEELQFEIMHGEIGQELANIVRELNKLIRSNEFKEFIKITAKIIAFIIRHLPLILALLGARGLYMLIGKNANIMALFNMQLKEGIILTSLFAKDGVTAFLANAKAATIFYAKLSTLLITLATIEDMIFGFLHLFGLTKRESLTGDLFDAMLGKGQTGIGTDTPGGSHKWRSRKDVEFAKNLYKKQRDEGWDLVRGKNLTWFQRLSPLGLPARLVDWNVGLQSIRQANKQLEYIRKEEQNMNLNYTVYVVDQTGNANQNIQNIVVKTLSSFFEGHNNRFNDYWSKTK